jgi:light-regulated signal transduction histidine kinase (bacteriophytochrome)
MQDIFQDFQTQLENLEIPETNKIAISNAFEKAQKIYTRLDFLHRRGMKDKSITINILQNTVDELQKQKDYIVCSNEQLTHQKQQLEDQSQAMSKNLHALQLSYNELEQFAFIASHDLKSPLRNIGSYAQLLKKRYYHSLDDDANVYLDFIVNNAQMMNAIINDLLEYNQVNNDKETVLIDFGNLINSIQLSMGDTIEENNATIEYTELPTLWVQKSAITQLFQNLIDNAIKYRSDEKPVISINAHKIKDAWQFSIKDNGIGLDESYNEKAFNLFQRIDKREQSGTGLGLAICRKVVKLHGGDIWFKKNIDGGTTFFFTIPQIVNHYTS